MKFLILLLYVTSIFGFNFNQINSKVNNLPDYEIPNWVYEKVFKSNVKNNYDTNQLAKNTKRKKIPSDIKLIDSLSYKEISKKSY